jgi:hypothetical protein
MWRIMAKIFVVFLMFALSGLARANKAVQEGDIIFQTSRSRQSQAIQLATKSKYSHMGIIFKDQGRFYVYEAVQPVKKTLLAEWIARGQDQKYVLKRLKNHDRILTFQTLANMKKMGESFMGKDYDLTFEWSDQRMYCSELVWKIYKQGAGVEVGRLQRLGDFDLSDARVKAELQERFGQRIPVNEIIISPAAIFESKLLTEVRVGRP